MENEQTIITKDSVTSREYSVRLAKVAAMRAIGIDPWPQPKEVSATIQEIVTHFQNNPNGEALHTVAGRIMAIRTHGKTLFAQIEDSTGHIQLYIRQDIIGESVFDQFQDFIDIGDILWIAGSLFTTKTGEITIRVTEYTLLSKCLHPLPEKFHGLSDIETIYRQRYLDLITNTESRKRFQKRFAIIRHMRTYFDAHGFIEVETPMLHPIPGGAAARPFVTHHNALDLDFYLRIAPELYLKRLIIGGFEKVYEINRNFRNEGISTRHNPEFTMVECYIAHKDYHYMMDFVESMIRAIAQEVNGTTIISYGGKTIDIQRPFKRLSMYDAIIQYGDICACDLKTSTIHETAHRLNISIANSAPWGTVLLALFEERAEKKLDEPTFIIDYPIEISPLTKRDPSKTMVVPRFELFICGMEISNGYNELNDPFDQAARFKEQAQERAKGNAEAHYYDNDYITALEYGLPPTVGAGIGVDRLTMLLTDATSIKDVILFPALKKRDE